MASPTEPPAILRSTTICGGSWSCIPTEGRSSTTTAATPITRAPRSHRFTASRCAASTPPRKKSRSGNRGQRPTTIANHELFETFLVRGTARKDLPRPPSTTETPYGFGIRLQLRPAGHDEYAVTGLRGRDSPTTRVRGIRRRQRHARGQMSEPHARRFDTCRATRHRWDALEQALCEQSTSTPRFRASCARRRTRSCDAESLGLPRTRKQPSRCTTRSAAGPRGACVMPTGCWLTHCVSVRLAADGRKMLGEGGTIPVGVEDILAGVQKSADPVEIEEKLELGYRVVPCSCVEAVTRAASAASASTWMSSSHQAERSTRRYRSRSRIASSHS